MPGLGLDLEGPTTRSVDTALRWNTFLGASGDDGCRVVVVDGLGEVHVVGQFAASRAAKASTPASA